MISRFRTLAAHCTPLLPLVHYRVVLFFLIGLNVPGGFKQIALAAVGVLFLMVMRVPAVLLSTKSMGLGKKKFWFLGAAIPRGLN
jgi:hypothetical protein